MVTGFVIFGMVAAVVLKALKGTRYASEVRSTSLAGDIIIVIVIVRRGSTKSGNLLALADGSKGISVFIFALSVVAAVVVVVLVMLVTLRMAVGLVSVAEGAGKTPILRSTTLATDVITMRRVWLSVDLYCARFYWCGWSEVRMPAGFQKFPVSS